MSLAHRKTERDTAMNSAVDVWGKVLDIIRNELSEITISTFFDNCSAVEIKGNRLILHTPTKYMKETIEERYLGIIKSALNELFSSSDFEVIILDDEGLNAMTDVADEPSYLGIDEYYTFEHFVVGNSNRFAHAAALAVADGKRDYNPLFIHGESGIGKTHLLYAIRHAVEKKFPYYSVICVKGEDFTNDMITALRQGKNEEFREKYRGADFFLIDDIQFIAGKMGTQEEFFHTFNTLSELGKQIVFTSDRPPKEISTLEDRLRNRFEQGLLADMQPPDEALRVAIIKNKAVQFGVVLPDDVTNYIADNLDSNVRQLEGAVKMIIAYKDLMDEEITLPAVKERLKDIFKGERELIPTTSDIIEETANSFRLTPEDLIGISRQANIALARHIAVYLVRRITNLSLNEIGKEFGGKHHTTIRNSYEFVEKRMAEDKDFSNMIRDITSNIDSKNR